jgi:hypothetical protein
MTTALKLMHEHVYTQEEARAAAHRAHELARLSQSLLILCELSAGKLASVGLIEPANDVRTKASALLKKHGGHG